MNPALVHDFLFNHLTQSQYWLDIKVWHHRSPVIIPGVPESEEGVLFWPLGVYNIKARRSMMPCTLNVHSILWLCKIIEQVTVNAIKTESHLTLSSIALKLLWPLKYRFSKPFFILDIVACKAHPVLEGMIIIYVTMGPCEFFLCRKVPAWKG